MPQLWNLSYDPSRNCHATVRLSIFWIMCCSHVVIVVIQISLLEWSVTNASCQKLCARTYATSFVIRTNTSIAKRTRNMTAIRGLRLNIKMASSLTWMEASSRVGLMIDVMHVIITRPLVWQISCFWPFMRSQAVRKLLYGLLAASFRWGNELKFAYAKVDGNVSAQQ